MGGRDDEQKTQITAHSGTAARQEFSQKPCQKADYDGACGDDRIDRISDEQTADQIGKSAYDGAGKRPVRDCGKKDGRVFQADPEIARDVYGKKLAEHDAERNKKRHNDNCFDIFKNAGPTVDFFHNKNSLS